MQPPRRLVPRNRPRCWAACALLLAGLGINRLCGQDPSLPPSSTARISEAQRTRARRLAERARLMQEHVGLDRAGKRKEAVEVLGKILVIERSLLGEFHDLPQSSLWITSCLNSANPAFL
jgi:hypothetical protein